MNIPVTKKYHDEQVKFRKLAAEYFERIKGLSDLEWKLMLSSERLYRLAGDQIDAAFSEDLSDAQVQQLKRLADKHYSIGYLQSAPLVVNVGDLNELKAWIKEAESLTDKQYELL